MPASAQTPELSEGMRRVLALAHARVGEERAALLRSLDLHGVQRTAGGTKPQTGQLSPGCEACRAGTWSCLFITSACTADCFYCPRDPAVAPLAEPTAEGLSFADVETYLAYLERFRFRGVSFSGGEPLLVPDRLERFLTAIKRRFGAGVYVWMYSNGDLLTDKTLRMLRDAGLDEIRLNISARAYDVEPVALARRWIPAVTVEIPAIPEDEEQARRALVELDRLGLARLNLHQLFAIRATLTRMARRGYLFLRPPFQEAPVVQSELTALRLILFALENRLRLSVNYCSHVYKARYQELGWRLRAAREAQQPHETITPAGYLREFSVEGGPDPADSVLALDAGRAAGAVAVRYDECRLVPPSSPLVGSVRKPIVIHLTPGADVVAGRIEAMPRRVLAPKELQLLRQHVLDGSADSVCPLPDDVAQFERIPRGLETADPGGS